MIEWGTVGTGGEVVLVLFVFGSLHIRAANAKDSRRKGRLVGAGVGGFALFGSHGGEGVRV